MKQTVKLEDLKNIRFEIFIYNSADPWFMDEDKNGEGGLFSLLEAGKYKFNGECLTVDIDDYKVKSPTWLAFISVDTITKITVHSDYEDIDNEDIEYLDIENLAEIKAFLNRYRKVN